VCERERQKRTDREKKTERRRDRETEGGGSRGERQRDREIPIRVTPWTRLANLGFSFFFAEIQGSFAETNGRQQIKLMTGSVVM